MLYIYFQSKSGRMISLHRFLGDVLVLLVIAGIAVATPFSQWPFHSSRTNAEIVDKEYMNSPVERYIGRSFGDEIPDMRDDLIRRKHEGEGFFERHYHAWTTPSNWKVDPDNNRKEREDPAVRGADQSQSKLE